MMTREGVVSVRKPKGVPALSDTRLATLIVPNVFAAMNELERPAFVERMVKVLILLPSKKTPPSSRRAASAGA